MKTPAALLQPQIRPERPTLPGWQAQSMKDRVILLGLKAPYPAQMAVG